MRAVNSTSMQKILKNCPDFSIPSLMCLESGKPSMIFLAFLILKFRDEYDKFYANTNYSWHLFLYQFTDLIERQAGIPGPFPTTSDASWTTLARGMLFSSEPSLHWQRQSFVFNRLSQQCDPFPGDSGLSFFVWKLEDFRVCSSSIFIPAIYLAYFLFTQKTLTSLFFLINFDVIFSFKHITDVRSRDVSTVICRRGFRRYSLDYTQYSLIYFSQCMSGLWDIGSQCIDYARSIIGGLWVLYVSSDLFQSKYVLN